MNEHLTDVELHGFASGQIAADDLLRADDHLSVCGQCRARASVLNDAVRRAGDLTACVTTPESHVTDEDIQLFVEGRSSTEASAAVVRHLNLCTICAAQVQNLRSWTDSVPQERAASVPRVKPFRFGRLALAATILLAIAIPTAFRYARHRDATAPPSLDGLDTLAPAERERVRAALAAGVVTLPDFMTDLTPSADVLMGPPERRETFGLVSPIGTATVSDRPRLEWQTLPNADSYVVTVYDEQSRVMAHSPATSDTHWVPTDPLPRGRTYVWQVAAHRPESTVTMPAAPAPPARFHVVDASSAAALELIEAKRPQAHLLLGIMYMEAGVRDAARNHLQQVESNEPYADVAQRSLRRLR